METDENGKTSGAPGSSVMRISAVVTPVNSGGSFTNRMGSETGRTTAEPVVVSG